jgi:hypothetical protein
MVWCLRGRAEQSMHLLRRGPGIAQALGRGLLALGEKFANKLGIVNPFGKIHDDS